MAGALTVQRDDADSGVVGSFTLELAQGGKTRGPFAVRAAPDVLPPFLRKPASGQPVFSR